MNFSPNKTPIEIIKEGAFGSTILETFIVVLMRSGTKIHGKNLFVLKISMLNFMHQSNDVKVNNYGLKSETPLRF